MGARATLINCSVHLRTVLISHTCLLFPFWDSYFIYFFSFSPIVLQSVHRSTRFVQCTLPTLGTDRQDLALYPFKAWCIGRSLCRNSVHILFKVRLQYYCYRNGQFSFFDDLSIIFHCRQIQGSCETNNGKMCMSFLQSWCTGRFCGSALYF